MRKYVLKYICYGDIRPNIGNHGCERSIPAQVIVLFFTKIFKKFSINDIYFILLMNKKLFVNVFKFVGKHE